MKVLLAILTTTMITSVAYGACGVGSLQECTTAEACSGLSKEGGVRYSIQKNAGKDVCMAVDPKAVAGCEAINGSKLPATTGTTDKKEPPKVFNQ
ncbi:MAG: hypothetical protein K2Q18_14125 [Bdellovibrionales bacterium]|nr:hypothetical protein [Bdellovibrionales bacterium]